MASGGKEGEKKKKEPVACCVSVCVYGSNRDSSEETCMPRVQETDQRKYLLRSLRS